MAFKKYFTFSYDDGVKQDKRFIDILNHYGLRATFNLNFGLMPKEPDAADRCLALSEVNEIYKGHEIATHGLKHPHYRDMNYDEICADIRPDLENLTKLAGYPTTGHAYPYGEFSDTTVRALRDCGIRYARTTRSTHSFALPEEPLTLHPTCHHGQKEIFTLIDEFINADPTESDLLFYVWGHTYEFDNGTEFNSWEHIEKVCRLISGKNDIEYVTNMQFFDR
ncbi:MAG: polysaccharide deacetylase [Ruminococcaceae bacterium]|nr:polysaccharide deacetylase [Oscillospiraceae bacterium]